MTNENSATFGAANAKAKLVSHLARLIRRYRLDYAAFETICKAARKETSLRRPARSRRLPRVLPEAGLRAFYEAVDQSGNLQHQIMLRLLFYTAVRGRKRTNVDAAEVVRRREQGQSWRDIAAGTGVGLGTVFRAYQSFRNTGNAFH